MVDSVEAALSRPRPIAPPHHAATMENTSATVKIKRLRYYPPRMYLPHRFVTNLGTVYFASSSPTEDLYTSFDSQIIRRQRFTRCAFSLRIGRVKVRLYSSREISAIVLLTSISIKIDQGVTRFARYFPILFPHFPTQGIPAPNFSHIF